MRDVSSRHPGIFPNRLRNRLRFFRRALKNFSDFFWRGAYGARGLPARVLEKCRETCREPCPRVVNHTLCLLCIFAQQALQGFVPHARKDSHRSTWLQSRKNSGPRVRKREKKSDRENFCGPFFSRDAPAFLPAVLDRPAWKNYRRMARGRIGIPRRPCHSFERFFEDALRFSRRPRRFSGPDLQGRTVRHKRPDTQADSVVSRPQGDRTLVDYLRPDHGPIARDPSILPGVFGSCLGSFASLFRRIRGRLDPRWEVQNKSSRIPRSSLWGSFEEKISWRALLTHMAAYAQTVVAATTSLSMAPRSDVRGDRCNALSIRMCRRCSWRVVTRRALKPTLGFEEYRCNQLRLFPCRQEGHAVGLYEPALAC